MPADGPFAKTIITTPSDVIGGDVVLNFRSHGVDATNESGRFENATPSAADPICTSSPVTRKGTLSQPAGTSTDQPTLASV
jgi:hypothetical protein